MNIFVLDSNPEKAARFHNDRHVVKMILESCQLLATAHHFLDGAGVQGVPLRPTHMHHPCALWVQRGPEEYTWLWRLTQGLLSEFDARYQHPHSYAAHAARLQRLPRNLPSATRAGLAPHPQCMPDIYKVPRNAVLAYRRYYYGSKQHLAQWHAPATMPEWWDERALWPTDET